jgi:4-diphosphocytidyl-2-C-methyl-D-erythritol kinase
MSLLILSPAKINLFLHVTGRRPDGYHDLLSLMCRVGLYDEVLLRRSSGALTLSCSDPSLPCDETNLALRAARSFFDAAGRKGGCDIRLTKRIPVAAGLGGGSSNAASVLLGLNHLYGSPVPREDLMRLGRTLGADVPFFLFQAPALASGIGDELEAFPGLAPWRVLIVCPPFHVSTRMVYQNLKLQLTKLQKQPTRTHLKKTAFNPSFHLQNDLEAVTLALHPELVRIKDGLKFQGAIGALMSGSGPSVFGLFPDEDAVRHAKAGLMLDRGFRLFTVDLLTGPVRLIQELGPAADRPGNARSRK